MQTVDINVGTLRVNATTAKALRKWLRAEANSDLRDRMRELLMEYVEDAYAEVLTDDESYETEHGWTE